MPGFHSVVTVVDSNVHDSQTPLCFDFKQLEKGLILSQLVRYWIQEKGRGKYFLFAYHFQHILKKC